MLADRAIVRGGARRESLAGERFCSKTTVHRLSNKPRLSRRLVDDSCAAGCKPRLIALIYTSILPESPFVTRLTTWDGWANEMVGSVNIDVPPMSIGGPAVPVNLGEAFSRGATGPSVPDTLSFDGRVSDSDLAQAGTKVVDPARLDQAVQEITSYGQNLGRSLAIRVDERDGNFIVSVQNAMTDEVVRQIPSEEVLRISALIEERNEALTLMGEKGAGGLFLDTVT